MPLQRRLKIRFTSRQAEVWLLKFVLNELAAVNAEVCRFGCS